MFLKDVLAFDDSLSIYRFEVKNVFHINKSSKHNTSVKNHIIHTTYDVNMLEIFFIPD